MDDLAWNPFGAFSAEQREKMEAFEEQLLRFNPRVNLISSETEDAFRTRHLLHCLTLTAREFPDGCTIVDWGTGGGLPAIPLAICHPEATVVGVDSVGKKVRAVRTIARRLGLENCFTWNGRAKEWTGEAHYSVSRATAPLATLWQWHRRVAVDLQAPPREDEWEQGVLTLKGGNLSGEIADLRAMDSDASVARHSLEDLLGRNGFFGEKEIVAAHS
ncbi:16S rRNA (guanine(527)-N(7))-methyltransferase RsmG [Salinibacter altiplanensis]|uniref:16S rRNA (guanine(527)-N(7))-methyltransferase RsmG n=1 Tax=Salinibacter altiplanensis TaxID=1803181 RepID=UPI000C9F828F|nr:RsmG family class I SAM-dependent methyltransferase [Salinibacter altiplanensis]